MKPGSLEWHHQVVADREKRRAEICECGHRRGGHQDDVAGCWHGIGGPDRCRCYSFRIEVKP